MDTDDAFGAAFLAHYNRGHEVYYGTERDDGYLNIMNTTGYFADSSHWRPEELTILEHVQSPVMDIGCGAGRHSLYLQDKGFDVLAVDNSSGAVEVCKKRGVRQVEQYSIFDLSRLDRTFSSFLMFGNNINLAGSYYGTIGFLQEIKRLSKPGAVLLGTYMSPLPTDKPYHLEYHQRNRDAGNPIGQVIIRVRFENYLSQWIEFYLPTSEEFDEILTKSGWKLVKDITVGTIHHVVLEILNN